MSALLPRVVSDEARLAGEFLATLTDARAPWAADFERFADQHHLGAELRRSVKVAVLNLRVFHATERHARRGRR